MTGKDRLLRPLVSSDHVEWHRLWKSYLSFYKTELSDEIYQHTFSALLDKDPFTPSCLVIAMQEGQDARLCGLVHYLFHAHCWKRERVCYLQDLFVDPNYRKFGLGRRLIEGVYATADSAGSPSVYWMTQDFNHDARKLYDRIGVLTPFIKYNRHL